MAEVNIDVDTRGLEEMARNIDAMKRKVLQGLVTRGFKIFTGKQVGDKTSGEVPYATGNLVRSTMQEIDYETMSGAITVTGRTGRTGAGAAEVFDAAGKKVKTVTLRPRPGFNYAQQLVTGRPSISPKVGKALLIPVTTAPDGEGYLMIGGQIYIYRRSAKAVPPNPFDQRAARRLEEDAPKIVDLAMRETVK